MSTINNNSQAHYTTQVDNQVESAIVTKNIDSQIANAMVQLTMPKANFDERADMHHHRHHHEHDHHKRKSLAARLPQRPQQAKKKNPNAAQSANGHDDEDGLHTHAAAFVDKLHKNDETDLDQALDEQYDSLSEHTLLDEAKHELQKRDYSPEEKQRLTQVIDKKMKALERNPQVLEGREKAYQIQEIFEAQRKSATQNEGGESASLRKLRGMLGVKPTGRNDEPLSPLSLAKSLQGVDNIDGMLTDLSRKFANGLTVNARSRIEPGPLWMSFKDMHSIAAVKTSFNAASDVRRNLSERANVLPKHDQITTAVILLAVAEAGGCRADQLIEKLIGPQTMMPSQRANACAVCREAVAAMPDSWWPQDKLSERTHLMDELRQMSSGASLQIPHNPKPEDILEQRLRTGLTTQISVH